MRAVPRRRASPAAKMRQKTIVTAGRVNGGSDERAREGSVEWEDEMRREDAQISRPIPARVPKSVLLQLAHRSDRAIRRGQGERNWSRTGSRSRRAQRARARARRERLSLLSSAHRPAARARSAVRAGRIEEEAGGEGMGWTHGRGDGDSEGRGRAVSEDEAMDLGFD
jgi:hypothetical protein